MARDGNHTKELIARTALHLFVEQGITETTIRDIAGAAGVAEGTLYRHFESKDQLAWELFSTNYLAFARELDRLQEEYDTLQEKLAAMIRQFCAFFDRDPVLFSYLLLAQHAQLKKVTPEMQTAVTVLQKVIAQGMAQGEVPEMEVELAAAMVLGVVLEVATFKAYNRITQDLSQLSETLVASCWRVLTGDGTP
ncbi:MAG: TetR/AcrR family transcriptional regulator [Syntrophales bacterium]|nr:TetR/AcrR family transcriptional regulator [Syntrophales bacterium]MDD5640273.1 TetR/AcrR family transcriptional regulator [Syntrophales bacterium]